MKITAEQVQQAIRLDAERKAIETKDEALKDERRTNDHGRQNLLVSIGATSPNSNNWDMLMAFIHGFANVEEEKSEAAPDAGSK